MYNLIFEQRDGSDLVCGIILDFAKTLDCVDRQIFLNKLEHYGARGNVLKLLSSYLTNRLQYIVNNDEQISSNILPISIGVPHKVKYSGRFYFWCILMISQISVILK